MTLAMFFIEYAFSETEQLFFYSWIFTVVVSIILHELAHGWAALALGDSTPRDSGHMTLNPMVHLGPLSMIFLMLAGMAWGAMPVDVNRLRSRYGDAIVSVAGPLMNLLLGLAGLTVLAYLKATSPAAEGDDALVQNNIFEVLRVFGIANLVLCLFNLLPVPPLDGSRILANFVRPYRDFIFDPANQHWLYLSFFVAFMAASRLIPIAFSWANSYENAIMKLFS